MGVVRTLPFHRQADARNASRIQLRDHRIWDTKQLMTSQ